MTRWVLPASKANCGYNCPLVELPVRVNMDGSLVIRVPRQAETRSSGQGGSSRPWTIAAIRDDRKERQCGVCSGRKGQPGQNASSNAHIVVHMPLLCPSDLGHRSRSGTLCLIEPRTDIGSINQDIAGVAIQSSPERWQLATIRIEANSGTV